MTATFSGDPTLYPESFELFDDALPPTGANINVSPTALGHRTAWLRALLQRALFGGLLTFLPDTTGLGGIDLVKQRYESTTGRRTFWCGSSANNDLIQRTSYGEYRPSRWPNGLTASTLVSVGARYGTPYSDFEVDASGSVVAWAAGFDQVIIYDAGLATWSKQTSGIGFDPAKICLAVNPVTGKWCAVSGSGGAGNMFLATSSNKTTWTARTRPSGMPAGMFAATVAYADGVMVMQGFDGTNVYLARSTDDGVTWSAATVFALGFSAGTIGYYWPRPVKTSKAWLACVSNGSSTPGQPSKVYRSLDNGATWALVQDFAAKGFRSLAVVGDVVVAMVGANALAASIDHGASWFWVDGNWDWGSPTSARTIVGCDSRFVIAGGSAVSASVGFGYGKGDPL